MVNEQAKAELAARLAEVRGRVAQAARSAGRRAEDVTIVGVTKGVAAERVCAAHELGLGDFGENRIQEWLAKAPQVGGGPRWHFIGSLQTNKARYLSRGISVLHSLDRPVLLEAVTKHWAAWAGAVPQPLCFVEVNVSGEASKAGLAPEQVYDFVAPAVAAGIVKIAGLMTIAPYTGDPASVRWVFAELRELRDRLERRLGVGLPHLSMGMSGDYGVAVEEGATLVRVGTAIFGPRS